MKNVRKNCAINSTLLWFFLFGSLFFFSPSLLSQEKTQALPDDNEKFSSPRQTMLFFLDNISSFYKVENKEALKNAAKVFDLSNLPISQQLPAGEKLARKLIQILDRVERVNVYQSFPSTKGLRKEATRWTYSRNPPNRPDIRIELTFAKMVDGRWLLAQETAKNIDSMLDQVRELKEIKGLKKPLTLSEWITFRLVGKRLQKKVFILKAWQWIGLVLLVVFGVLLDWAFRFFILRYLLRKSPITRISLKKQDLENIERPLGLLLMSIIFVLGLPVLDLSFQIYSVLDIAASFILVVAGIWVVYRFVDLFCGHLEFRAQKTETKIDDVLIPLLRRTLKILVLILGVVFIASRLTPNIWGIFAGLSLGSLAVGFAAKDSIENLFGTFTVLLDKPFELGDWIQTDDIEGNVERVGFRSTKVRTFYNSIITIPNSRFIRAHVDNLGARRYRRIKTMLALTYDTPPEKIEAFCEGIRQIILKHPFTRKDYFHVYLNEFADHSLNILLYCFHETPDWATELRERQRLFLDILRLAERLKISFAFPTQTLHLAKPEDLQHPDKPKNTKEAMNIGRKTAGNITQTSLAEFQGNDLVSPPPK